MKRRAAADSLRRLCRALLLPLLLLCLQQGAFLHELSHYEPAQTKSKDHERGASSACALCAAFAGVDSAASPASPPPPLLTGLGFALRAAVASFAHGATAPAQRNRGPPDLL